MTRKLCRRCWTTYGRELWSQSCICSGHVPANAYPRVHVEPVKIQQPTTERLKSWTGIKVEQRFKT